MDCEGMTNTKAELILYKTCQFSSARRDCERLRPRLSSPPWEHELSPREVLPGPVVEVEQGGVLELLIRVSVDVEEGVIGGGVLLAPVDGGQKERFSEENGIFLKSFLDEVHHSISQTPHHFKIWNMKWSM